MIIELLCTIAGIIAGVAIFASLVQHQGARARFEAQQQEPVDTGRIQGIAEQLQAISKKVSANVSAHSEKVGKFSGQLSESGDDTPERLLETINEIISANAAMQGQLADAQSRIDQQKRMIEQASKQARTDALTGLANRRALDEFLINSIESANDGEHVALMLLDIDHFKNFNDSFGHTTGDAVLSSFARAIAQRCSDSSYPARFGGEEFAVVMTGEDVEVLLSQAADVRQFVSDQVISYDEMQLKITASAGFCLLNPTDSISTAYERADEGLYKSKEQGRNCGHWLNESTWQLFPSQEPPKVASESRDSTQHSTDEDQSLQATLSPFNGERPEIGASAEMGNEQKPDTRGAEILDLNAFLGRVEAQVNNLRVGKMTATAVLIEAVGLRDADPAEAATSWEHTVALIQINLRGLDLVCQFRPFTLCIFIPGCSKETAIERVALIHNSLPDAKADWPEIVSPDRLAIALAELKADEKPSAFLERLEMTLEDSLASEDEQLAISTGDGCEFLSI